MVSAKMATSGLLKIKLFWNQGYDIIIWVYDVTNKILSRNSNYIIDVVMSLLASMKRLATNEWQYAFIARLKMSLFLTMCFFLSFWLLITFRTHRLQKLMLAFVSCGLTINSVPWSLLF